MSTREIVSIYLDFRETLPVAEAATKTMSQCTVLRSELVNAFIAAQLDFSRPLEEAGTMQHHRNELVIYFDATQSCSTR